MKVMPKVSSFLSAQIRGAEFGTNKILGPHYLGVSKNNGTPKSSILMGFAIINHPFWGTPIFGNTHLVLIASAIGLSIHFPIGSMYGISI